MSKQSSYIKCANCGEFNSNSDYCKTCGELISFQKKVELRKKEEQQQRIDQVHWDIQNPNWVERLKNHPFFLFRIIGWVIYSAFLTVSIIGAGLAWFVAMVAAG